MFYIVVSILIIICIMAHKGEEGAFATNEHLRIYKADNSIYTNYFYVLLGLFLFFKFTHDYILRHTLYTF